MDKAFGHDKELIIGYGDLVPIFRVTVRHKLPNLSQNLLNSFKTNGIFHKVNLTQLSQDGPLYILRAHRL